MKTKLGIITIGLYIGALSACHAKQDENNQPPAPVTEQAAHSEPDKGDTLALNNGVKRVADVSTNKNVVGIKQIVENEKPVTVTDCQTAGKSLQQALNTMVSECRMTGPDHEALHRWLVPLIGEVHGMQQATTTGEAANRFNRIKNQVGLYPQYFQ